MRGSLQRRDSPRYACSVRTKWLLVALLGCDSSASPGVDGASASDAPLVDDRRPSTLGGADVLGSAGCRVASSPTGVQPLSLGGRTGVVVIPADYDARKAYPIVFVFHGDGGTGAGIRTQLSLEPDAAGKAIFAYPDGAQKSWDAALSPTNADMMFVMEIRAQLRASYCIDTTRTFLTGMSRGGYFVNQLACMYGVAEFAAIAPHSSTISQEDGSKYVYGPPVAAGGPYAEDGNYDFACPSDGTPPPARPILPPPAFVIHGACDAEGGVTYAQGRLVVEHWGFAARCATTPAVAVTTMPNPTCQSAGLTSDPMLSVDPCYAAPGCTAGHDVTFCAIPSMDHRIWAKAHARIWAFFAAH